MRLSLSLPADVVGAASSVGCGKDQVLHHLGVTESWCTTTTNNNNTQDDIYSVVYTAPAICKSSLWIFWITVGQRQVAANS